MKELKRNLERVLQLHREVKKKIQRELEELKIRKRKIKIKELEECKKESEAKIKQLETENKRLKETNEYIFLKYHSCGSIVKSKETGRYGVVLETMPNGTLMVLESIKPKVILLYNSMDELERTGR